MDFVNPALLAGAGLAAIPVILHFVMRQKPKRLEFPALRFIRQRREANQRRMRIQHWLLLALRVAAICLLALALARPSMRAAGNAGSGTGPVAAVLVFDTAPRMAYRHENQTRLEAAQEIAHDLLADFPEESQVAVLDTRGQPGVFQIDLSAADERIERLEITPTAQALEPTLEEAARILSESDRKRKEIYVFSDLSASAWAARASALEQRLSELGGVSVYIVDVGIEHPKNAGLGELRLSSQILSRTSPLVLATDITGVGAAGERVAVLEMLDENGKPQKRNQATFKLADNEPQRVEFAIGGLSTGTHQGQVRITGADGLPTDDVRYFSIEIQPAWRVLIAAPKPTQVTASYLNEALAPARFRQQGLARFDCQVVSHDELESAELRGYSALFVLDPPALPQRAWQRIAEFARTGGGVALFVGENAKPADVFNQAAGGLLPAPLKAPRNGPTQLVTRVGEHPVLRKFKPLADQVPWDAFPVYQYWELNELAEGAAPVANYATNSPAIVEQTFGSGRVALMTTSLSDPPDKSPAPWNRLLTGLRPWPAFMLVNELALYLVGSSDSQLNYLAGQPATLRLRPDERVSNYLLTTPRDEHIKGSVPARQDSITLAMTDAGGHYQVRAGGDEGFKRGFSVNLSPESTSLARIEQAQLEKLFGKQTIRVARDLPSMQRQVTSGRLGQEFYPFLIVMVALAVGFEQIVANRFYRQEQN